MTPLTWIEINTAALGHNIRQFRALTGPDVLLCPCVKANAYGHGLVLCADTFLAAGADWLAVNTLYEAAALRQAGITSPLYIMGYVPPQDAAAAVALDCRIVLYSPDVATAAAAAARTRDTILPVHIKVETGTNRQGIRPEDLPAFAAHVRNLNGLKIEGLTTHFADIEDTIDHSLAHGQLQRFRQLDDQLRAAGIDVALRHCANSAATILWQSSHFELARIGIGAYGMWPSTETRIAHRQHHAAEIDLRPAFTWKATVAQVKTVPAGDYVGYGRTYRATHRMRLAIVPIGYYDGYDRGLSGAHILIRGERAPLRGRICMNTIMADVTHIKQAQEGDTAVLLGNDGQESITAEEFARWADTINYEVTARVNDRIPRQAQN